MENDIAIQLEHISKVYKLYDRPLDRLKESLHPFHKRYSRDFFALDDVSFTVRKGETMGFIGKNGAGKSTLLKIITGVVTPTSGVFRAQGRIASLLELGAGFNPEMTGVENIYMNGMIMGCTREEMDARIEDIMAFADIGDFIYQPVKMYSSGMFARVAFAVNAFVEPDILIVDEALSVGDAFFQSKCIDRMKHMMHSGVTVLFVSHDWSAIKNLCQRGVLLDKGHMVMDASASEVVEEYRRMQLDARQSNILPTEDAPAGQPVQLAAKGNVWFENNQAFLKNAAYQRIQNGKLEFVNIQLLDMQERPVMSVVYGQMVILRMAILVHEDTACFGTGYHLRNAAGMELVYSDSRIEEQAVTDARAGACYLMDWRFRVSLREGKYNIACVMSLPVNLEARQVECCDFVPCAIQFDVLTNACEMGGYVHWHNDVDIRQV